MLGERRSNSLFAPAAPAEPERKPEQAEVHDISFEERTGRALFAGNATAPRASELFFAPQEKGVTFAEALSQVQGYLSETYATLITEDNSDAKEQMKRRMARYLQENRIAVDGMTASELVDALYTEMAEYGFLTVAFDPSFTGESGGSPRYVASPDINTEDFCAAVDFLSVQENIDTDRIGIIGICGWGGMAINAAAQDTRIKATAAMTMYDMTRVNANGYFDNENTPEARFAKKLAMNTQRTEDYKNGSYTLAGGVIDPLPDNAPQFVKDYYAYYKTERGYHPRSLNSNNGWNVTSPLSFMNMPILQYAAEIRSAVLLVHGEKAHSRYFSEGAYEKMAGDNKELLIIPGASHVDLYDNLDVIPFEKLNSFFNMHLK